MSVNGYEVAVLQNRGRVSDTVDAGDPQFTSDDSAMDEHSTSSFDNSSGKWDEVGHCRLNRIADENFTPPEHAQIVASGNTANLTRREAWSTSTTKLKHLVTDAYRIDTIARWLIRRIATYSETTESKG